MLENLFSSQQWQTVDMVSLIFNVSNAFFISVVPTFDSILYYVFAL